MDETGSPAVFTDAVSENSSATTLTITPTVQAQNESGSWELAMYTGTGVDIDGKAPTTGEVPTLGDNDFILFTAYKIKTTGTRVLNRFDLGDEATDAIAIKDGDAFEVHKSGAVSASVNNWGGANVAGEKGGLAIVRDGGNIGFWFYAPDSSKNIQYVGGTDSYTQYKDGNNVWGRRWDTDTPTCIFPPGEPNVNLPDDNGDIEGMWKCYTAGALSLGNKIQINNDGDVGQNTFGYALFEFENGLPNDWTTALKWMVDEWTSLNKVIYPSWNSLT